MVSNRKQFLDVLLDAVAAKRIVALDAELVGLTTEAARLAAEIGELVGGGGAGIV